jgi:hypothetical protein
MTQSPCRFLPIFTLALAFCTTAAAEDFRPADA